MSVKSDKATDVDPVWAEAIKAKDDAVKARHKSDHATAVVHVSADALAKAQSAAADAHLAAEASEKKAVDAANKARLALETELGLSSKTEAELTKSKVADKPKESAS